MGNHPGPRGFWRGRSQHRLVVVGGVQHFDPAANAVLRGFNLVFNRGDAQMTRQLPAFALASLATFGFVTTTLLGGSPAQAAYDNPSMGDTPCVVLSRYVGDEATDRLTVGGNVVHRAEVGIANICGRSVEVLLCVAYAEPVDGEEQSCFSGLLRPWSSTEIHSVEAPVQLAGPVIEWRWVSDTTGAAR